MRWVNGRLKAHRVGHAGQRPRPDRRGLGIHGPQLVDAANFLLATRDSGYRSTAYAVAEFVDNSLQAGATSVAIDVRAVGAR